MNTTKPNCSPLEMTVLAPYLMHNERVRRLQWPLAEYYVTDAGRVISVKWNKVRILSAREKANSGYMVVNLSSEGEVSTHYVHHLVLESFTGTKPTREWQTRHLDGDAANNSLSNLQLGTAWDNAQDRIKHGTWARGESVGTAKLTRRKVQWVKDLYAASQAGNSNVNLRITDLAEIFDVSKTSISNIINDRTWRTAQNA
jgi:hypothetical protein